MTIKMGHRMNEKKKVRKQDWNRENRENYECNGKNTLRTSMGTG